MSIGASIAFFLAALASLFTIVNPFSTAPIFVSLTQGNTHKRKLAIIKRAALTSGIILIVFTLVGHFILSFFSITVDAFRIAGGIFIAGIGLTMLNGGKEHFRSEKARKEAHAKEDISIVPLAIPMLSGPGAITTVLVLSGEATNALDTASIICAILIVSIASYFIIAEGDTIVRRFGENKQHLLEKLMGLIVLVVGIQFVINGMSGVLLSWGII